jgi:hypothetical protein
MTVTPALALNAIPSGLRDPLLEEYQRIVQNYFERRWLDSELSGGRLCEIVYSILEGYAAKKYPATAKKPKNMVQACRDLENHSHVPRSFQILIPRLLPALFEIRNNRNVGHVSGEIDSNHMDATAVLEIANWIMAELVRVFHNLSIDEAQRVVDQLIERRTPIIWQIGDIKRVLNPKMKIPDQLLMLTASCAGGCSLLDLIRWTDYFSDPKYIKRQLNNLHDKRYLEVTNDGDLVQILPPGSKYIQQKLIPKYSK